MRKRDLLMFDKLNKTIGNNIYFALFYLFISLCFTSILKEIPFINLLSKLALVWGVLLAFYNIIKIIKRKPNLIELSIFIFLGYTLLANLLIYRSSGNLKVWIVNLILFMGLFFIDNDKDKKELIKDIGIFSYSISIFTFIFSLAANITYFGKISFTLKDTVYGLNQGLYIYKNALAIASGIGIIVTLYLIMKKQNLSIKAKLFFRINILLQVLSLIFSKGRSGYFLIIAVPFVLIFMKYKNKIFRRCMIIIPAILCIGGFAAFHEKLYTFLSARNELWYSAWLLIKKHPVLGVGNSDLVEKVYSMRPGVILPGIEAGGLHNIFLQITTANGFIGLVLFLFVLSTSLTFLVKKIDFSFAKQRKINLVGLSLIVGIIFVNLFEADLIYIVSFIPIIFWTYLGYFISILKDSEL
ncbi:O-antigen ligase [Clostridium sp. DSM 8431]|uniref:O-antigen ligase family protein n=1 Tax=Clostridium sp. DSM 8431 TaxID=1761781 RepID=UPI0008DF3C1F|nr:O-antigen ligase family protein [Clostridium sp. DSM 8431]SFU65316.1 O-antigen ligase [Clostridium sp. DSM 8431]